MFIKSYYTMNVVRESIKMSRNSKKKPETDLQLLADPITEEKTVITADCGNGKMILRKEEASKPLYLKRV
jgi:hypothetical protein